MRKTFMLSAVIIAVPLSLPAATPQITAHDLQQQVHKRGAHAVMRGLSPREFDTIVRHAAAGDVAWLAAAAQLRSGTDGANSEGIDFAFSRALATNPSEVLRQIRLQPRMTLPWICRDRSIEPDAREVKHFTAQAIAALRQVKGREFEPERDRCISLLKQASEVAAR